MGALTGVTRDQRATSKPAQLLHEMLGSEFPETIIFFQFHGVNEISPIIYCKTVPSL